MHARDDAGHSVTEPLTLTFSRTDDNRVRACISNGTVEMAFVKETREDAGDLAVAMAAHLWSVDAGDIADALVVVEPEE